MIMPVAAFRPAGGCGVEGTVTRHDGFAVSEDRPVNASRSARNCARSSASSVLPVKGAASRLSISAIHSSVLGGCLGARNGEGGTICVGIGVGCGLSAAV
jgi:hypothetical protein